MAKHLFLFYLFLLKMVLGSTASISPEAYWKLKLPYTPMPQSILSSLAPAPEEQLGGAEKFQRVQSIAKETLVSMKSYDGYLSYFKQGRLDSTTPKYLSYQNQESVSTKSLDSENPKYLSYNDNKQGLETTGYGGLLSYSYKKKHLDSHNVHDEDNSVTKDTVFFVEKDLQLGTKKTLHFKKSASKVMFLPRQVSNQIPFQSNKIQETLKILSLDPKSKEADFLSKRIELCEEPTIEGVEKKCVTSLESMVDYVISMLGTNVRAITSQVEKDYSKMEYTFKGVKKLAKYDHETVVCHKLGYPYAVFFCHRTTTIRSYLVNLVGKDGSKIEALAACHKESNDFLDKYAKNVLHVVPGSTRICHFPPAADTIIWVPKY